MIQIKYIDIVPNLFYKDNGKDGMKDGKYYKKNNEQTVLEQIFIHHTVKHELHYKGKPYSGIIQFEKDMFSERIIYYKNGLKHNEYGFAKIWANNTGRYYLYGKMMRNHKEFHEKVCRIWYEEGRITEEELVMEML